MKNTIVLADGCFDPLHEGHIAYLNAARALGTSLVVNMATDREIWEKRPKLGPFLNEQERAAVLGAFKGVDRVIMYDTAKALKEIKPDIYVKGKDWESRLPEEELRNCRSLGIRVAFVDTVTNSSTGLLERFLGQVKL